MLQKAICLIFQQLVYLFQIISQFFVFEPNHWYNISFSNITHGSADFDIYVNGAKIDVIASPFDEINFSELSGPLYIGGHPYPLTIDVSSFYAQHNLIHSTSLYTHFMNIIIM